MKIVINRCYGGFGLSDEGVAAYAEEKGLDIQKGESMFGVSHFYLGDGREDQDYFYVYNIDRDDPALVSIVERTTSEDEYGFADGNFASLVVVEIPDGVEWGIEEYDGMEWVAEQHRTWG